MTGPAPVYLVALKCVTSCHSGKLPELSGGHALGPSHRLLLLPTIPFSHTSPTDILLLSHWTGSCVVSEPSLVHGENFLFLLGPLRSLFVPPL